MQRRGPAVVSRERAPLSPPASNDGVSLIVASRVLALASGFYLIRIAAAAADGADLESSSLSLLHLSTPPFADGAANAAIIDGAAERGRFLPPSGGLAFARVGSSGGAILVSAYGPSAVADRSLDIVVERLDRPPSPTPHASPTAPQICTEIGLTIERLGSRRFIGGGWAGSRAGHLQILALALRTLDPDALIALEVKAFTAGNRETAWIADGAPAAFGNGEVALTGFAARVASPADRQFWIVYYGSFAQGGTIGPHRDGELCRSRIRDDPLAAVAVWISARTPG